MKLPINTSHPKVSLQSQQTDPQKTDEYKQIVVLQSRNVSKTERMEFRNALLPRFHLDFSTEQSFPSSSSTDTSSTSSNPSSNHNRHDLYPNIASTSRYPIHSSIESIQKSPPPVCETDHTPPTEDHKRAAEMRRKQKTSWSYVFRSGLAGGIAGCAVS
jgi:hypothetical protein